ncbi:acyl carrier protein [Actinoplanes sp. NPDC049316]|uniref:acyl carrier protein n=1 Tax=Actinoplanes sp. NPDC049316 TaxID=3154727 RepID=UPI0034197D32
MTSAQQTGITAAEVARAVTDIVHTELAREVDPAVDMFDQGATSLAFLRIVARVNERFDITTDVGELEEASVDGLSALVAAQLGAPNTARD